ncbi:MAG TPA: magnesium/cobalt transporter CorA [Anaerolineae bacterium]|nr:magnesium/cobalt transporter CorA [Anaerolineae bacterium]
MIRVLYCLPDGTVRYDLKPEEFGAALQNEQGLLWVDFDNTSIEVDEPILLNTFRFHPLAVDDALRESHVPKVDDWESYVYIVLHSVVFDQQAGDQVNTLELDVFLGHNFIVTHHDASIAAIERVWTASQRDERHRKGGPDHLLYKLTDEIVTDYMPVVEEMDDAIDSIENQIFSRPTPATLERLFGLKRAVARLRRILGPQREVLNKLARDDYAMIDARDRVYFRDVYDHLVRLHDITESLRDLVGGALDTYLSVINNRMNDVMKTLTIITTLFMPLAFVTGFFGMNFFQPTTAALDPWTSLPVFAIALAIILLIPAGMYFWMRRRGWM